MRRRASRRLPLLSAYLGHVMLLLLCDAVNKHQGSVYSRLSDPYAVFPHSAHMYLLQL